MSARTAAVIGAGPPPEAEQPGYAIGHTHAAAYRELDAVELVATADLDRDHALAFADRFGLPEDHTFTDYEELLDDVAPDIVSVCTPPQSHLDVVSGCARAGVPAIHCEKPMAITWADCRHLVDVCERRSVQLTINHQRRFVSRWRRPLETLRDGSIGELRRVELAAPDLLDWGTHCFDLAGMYAGDVPASWAFGQVGPAVPDRYGGAYDHHNESGALGTWQYENGVRGLAATGEFAALVGGDVYHRLVGSEGIIEIDGAGDVTIRRDGRPPEPIPIEDGQSGFAAAIEDAVSALASDREPVLLGRRALNATALIFGIWESARRRARVEFPLRIADNPLEAMVESGTLSVRRESR